MATPAPEANGRGALEHRAAKVSLVNVICTVLSIAFQLISVPVCFHYWGKETYGSWLALLSAYMLLRGLDAGYGAFVGNKMNLLYHKSIGALREHLASAVVGTTVIGLLQLILAAGILFLGSLSAMVSMPAEQADSSNARWGLLALTASWVLTGSYLGIVSRLLIPAGLMYQSAWWAMAFPVGQFGAVMVSAVLRLNMLETSLLCALSQAVISVATARYVHRVLPEFSPWLRGARTEVGLRDLGDSMLLAISNLIQQSATNGAILLVSVMAGPIAVSMFTTVRTLTILWNSITAILSTPLLPDVVRIHAKREVAKLVAINRAYWVLAGSAVNLGALLSYPLIPSLYSRWTAHAIALDQPLLCLMLGSVVVGNSGALMALHLNGINSLRIVLAASLIRAVVGLGGGAAGYPIYGLASFGFSTLTGEIVATLMTARFFLRHEIEAKGARISLFSFGPVLASTGSALLYFVGSAFGWWSIGVAWMMATACSAAASVWGWYTLEPELQVRLRGIPAKLLGL